MRSIFVDLYQNYNVIKPDGASGTLQCWIQDNGAIASSRRMRPGILVVPGGGYRHVSPREAEPVALRFLARGYNAFILNYSVAPLKYPTALREAAMAMRYIRENAEELGVGPHMVAATGFSAGGHLCGCLGTMYDREEVADIAAPEMIRPDALGLCYPVAVSWGRTHEDSFRNLGAEDGNLRCLVSLDKQVRPDMPPVFLWHTGSDASVPCRNSLVLAGALAEKGVDFALHIYHKGCHGISTADNQVYPDGKVPECSWDVPGWIEAEIRFFEEIGIKTQDFEV